MNANLPDNPEALIRAARARSNAAIASHDLDAIVREWMTGVKVVSASGRGATGQAANRAFLAAQFEKRPDTVVRHAQASR